MRLRFRGRDLFLPQGLRLRRVPGRIWNPPLRAVGCLYTSHGRLLRRKRPRVVGDADLCGVGAASLSNLGVCGGGRWTRSGCLFILPVCRGEHCSPANFTQQRISREFFRKKKRARASNARPLQSTHDKIRV